MYAPKRFKMEGTIGDDADFPRLREQYEQLVILDMRESGYIPILGLGPFFSTKRREKLYEFVLTLYGVRVGKVKAWTLEGMDLDGKLVPRRIPPTKSKQSSEASE